MSDDHDEGDEEGGPTAAFSLVRYENPQIVQLEVEKTFLAKLQFIVLQIKKSDVSDISL